MTVARRKGLEDVLVSTSAVGRRALPRADVLRDLTDESVLDAVFVHGSVTRAEIARHTGITKPTIAEAVRRLSELGLLVAAGSQAGRPGRAGTLFELASDAGFVIGVELGSGGIWVSATDLFGQQIVALDYPPPPDVDGVKEILRRGVGQAMARGAELSHRLRAVSVSVANPVDPSTGAAVPLPETPYPEGVIWPAEVLAGMFSAPLLVDNDVNLATLAERSLGAGRSVDNFVYVYVGAGLGLGLILNGGLVRGARGLAGEIGFLPIGHAAVPQEARRRLARTAAAYGLAGTGDADGPGKRALALAEAVFVRAGAGDISAIELLEREGRAIGEAVAAVCAVVDPEIVILGGPLGDKPSLLPLVQRTVAEVAPVPVPVQHGTVGDNPSLSGAIVVALQHARAELLASVS